jgi:hypothetical protein
MKTFNAKNAEFFRKGRKALTVMAKVTGILCIKDQ